MADTESTITAIGECERKICDGEALLRKIDRRSMEGWFALGTAILLFVLSNLIFLVIGLLLIGFSGYRFLTVSKYRVEIEDGLREYRGRKAELLAHLIAKE